MGILRRLREWREDSTGTLIGPNIDAESVDAGSVNTEKIGSDYYYAGSYDGSDADARLDNALADATDRSTVYLEKETYAADRTISKPLKLVGSFGTFTAGSRLSSATWTIDSRIVLDSIELDDSSTITLDANNFSSCRGLFLRTVADELVVSTDDSLLYGIGGTGRVTFDSGTSNCLIDASTVDVTDNGSNTVGDMG